MSAVNISESRLYTPAQVAGISVGSSVGVLCLSVIIPWLLGGRNKHGNEPQRQSGDEAPQQMPGLTVDTQHKSPQPDKPTPLPSPIHHLIHLPEPIYEDELRLQASTLNHWIQDHVYEFYDDIPRERFVRKELSAGLTETNLEKVLNDRTRWTLLVRQYIAQQLLASLSPFSEPEIALLPIEWIRLIRSSPLHGPDTSGMPHPPICGLLRLKKVVRYRQDLLTQETDPDEFPSRSTRLWWLELWGALSAALFKTPKVPPEEIMASVAHQLMQKIEKAFP